MGRPRMKVGGHPCINNIAPRLETGNWTPRPEWPERSNRDKEGWETPPQHLFSHKLHTTLAKEDTL